MAEDQMFQLRNETVRTVNVKLTRRMYRRLALKRQHEPPFARQRGGTPLGSDV